MIEECPFDPTPAQIADQAVIEQRSQKKAKRRRFRTIYWCFRCQSNIHLDRWFQPGETVRCPKCQSINSLSNIDRMNKRLVDDNRKAHNKANAIAEQRREQRLLG